MAYTLRSIVLSFENQISPYFKNEPNILMTPMLQNESIFRVQEQAEHQHY
jgi:hypothetical protein